MKVKTKITYSALKLARRLPKMIDDYIENSAKRTVKNAKEIIDHRQHEKPNLSKMTKIKRKQGMVGGLKGFKQKYPGDTPLKYTGKLYDTMRATKDGIQMERYGHYHNIGMNTIVGGVAVRRPQRTFIKFKPSDEAQKQFSEELTKNFRK